MMTRTQIEDSLAQNELTWSGGLRGNALLVSLGAPIQPLARHSSPIDPMNPKSIQFMYAEPIPRWTKFVLKSKDFVLCQTAERIRLGSATAGLIATLSHFARLGVSIHLDSPIVECRFAGYLTLEIFNASPCDVLLHRGMPVGKIVLFQLRGASHMKTAGGARYGRKNDLRSKYALEFGGKEGGYV